MATSEQHTVYTFLSWRKKKLNEELHGSKERRRGGRGGEKFLSKAALLKIGNNLQNFLLKCCFDFLSLTVMPAGLYCSLKLCTSTFCWAVFFKKKNRFKKAVKQYSCLLVSILVENFQLFKYP